MNKAQKKRKKKLLEFRAKKKGKHLFIKLRDAGHSLLPEWKDDKQALPLLKLIDNGSIRTDLAQALWAVGDYSHIHASKALTPAKRRHSPMEVQFTGMCDGGLLTKYRCICIRTQHDGDYFRLVGYDRTVKYIYDSESASYLAVKELGILPVDMLKWPDAYQEAYVSTVIYTGIKFRWSASGGCSAYSTMRKINHSPGKKQRGEVTSRKPALADNTFEQMS